MDLKGKSVAVTGASGMIGVYICRSLLKAGAHVIGVVRNPQKAAFLAEEGVEFRTADLEDVEALTQAFQGCYAVVSNAAMYVVQKSMSGWEAHEKANLQGTENVYEAAHRAAVIRMIQISTFGIYKWSLVRTLDEDSQQLNGSKRQGGAYRATKQASEALAWKMSAKYELQMTALRPSGVYGARDNNLLRPVYKLLRIPFLPLPSISFPIVYAGDVADAVVAALQNTASIGQAYNVGGDKRQFSEFVKAVVDVLPKGPTIVPLPLPLSVKVDNSKAERDLGFHNRPFHEALQEIIREEPPRVRSE